MSKRFQRKVEAFTCCHCGQAVRGDGYTNHCPSCLWSRHVDVMPGDRAAECGGEMAPVAVEKKGSGYVLTHRCVDCGHSKRNKADAKDSMETMLKIARAAAGRG
ncbi:MAG: RNHCP domain-containing protein [Pseudomonadota bacterium]